MAELADINRSIKEQTNILSSFVQEQRRSRGDEQEQRIEQNILFNRLLQAIQGSGPNNASNSNTGSGSSSGSGGGGFLRGLGAGLAGGAIGRGAAGIAALGVAIPAFFGGLLAGDAAFKALKSFGVSFDYAGLKAAALGFSDIILAMDTKTFTVLATIMGVSAVGGTRAAKGLGSMGFAISAFFGGLLAGEALFDTAKIFGASLNFDSFKEVAVGFSDVILGLKPAAVAALAGIMTVSAIGGARAARGLGNMGFAISAFFGGLLAGEALFDTVVLAGGNLNFDSIKTLFTGFSDSITALTPTAVGTLGAIMAGGALIGYSSLKMKSLARGLGAIGMSMAAIFGGLLAGDLIAEGVQAIGGNLDFANIKTMFAGFSDTITALTPMAVATLGGIMASGAIVGYSGLKSKSLMRGLSAIGMGMVGIFGGMLLADNLLEGVSAIGGNIDFANIKTMFTGFSDSIAALSEDAVKALGGIMAVAGTLTVFKSGLGVSDAVQFGVYMTGIGAGIAGFMIGLKAGDTAISWLDSYKKVDSTGLVGAFKIFNDSVEALNNETALKAFGAILATAGGLSVLTSFVPGSSLVVAGGIFALMTGIGAGIAGFMTGLQAGDTAVSWLQAAKTASGGEGIVGIFKMFNDAMLALTPGALDAMKNISDLGALDIATSMTALLAGIGAFFLSDELTKLGGAIKAGTLGAIDYVFGSDLSGGSKKASMFEMFADEMEHLNRIDLRAVDNFTVALDKLSSAFSKFDISGSSNVGKQIYNSLAGMSMVVTALNALQNGQTWTPSGALANTELMKSITGYNVGRGDFSLDFGQGLRSITGEGATSLQYFRGAIDQLLAPTMGLSSGGNGGSMRLKELYVDVLTAERMNASNVVIAPTTNNSGGNTNNAFNVESDNAYDPAALARLRSLMQ